MRNVAFVSLAIVVGCGTESAGSRSPGDPSNGLDASSGSSSSSGTGTTLDATAPTSPISDPDAGGVHVPEDAAAPHDPCTSLAAQPLDSVWNVPGASGAAARTFRVHVPASYDPTHPTPVVLDFHGYSSNGWQEDFLDHMFAKSNSAGFIAVQPEGLNSSWNAGACCGQSATNAVDDLAFVQTMLDSLEAKLCVDSKRIFATGMSNGGFFSHRLGCELASRIAAVAPVAGLLGVPTCSPSRPMPVMHFHGTGDTVVPYAGDSTRDWPGATDSFASWAKRDGCTGEPVETYRKSDAHCLTYQTCAAGSEVTLCTIDNGGHTWPGGTPIPTGYTTPNLSATDAMWSFFEAHPMP